MTAPDPHRVLVGDLHAEIRRLRLTIAALRAELGEAQRHLNPPIRGAEVTEGDRTSPVVAELNPGSLLRPLSDSESDARIPTRGNLHTPLSDDSEALTVPLLSEARPASYLGGGIVVSPSVLAQRHAARVEDAGGELDDDEGEI